MPYSLMYHDVIDAHRTPSPHTRELPWHLSEDNARHYAIAESATLRNRVSLWEGPKLLGSWDNGQPFTVPQFQVGAPGTRTFF